MATQAKGAWQIIDNTTGRAVLDADGVWPLEYYDEAAAQVEANKRTTSTRRQHTVVKVLNHPGKGRRK